MWTQDLIYQKFFDGPGDRLLKWHLAGHVPITNDNFIKVLFDKYSSFSIQSFLDYKHTQFNIVFGEIFSKYTSFFQDSSETIVAKSFYYQEYSYLLYSSILLSLIYFTKIPNRREKIFINLLVVSYLLYNIIWVSLLMSRPILHHGSSFGWFCGLLSIFFVTYYFNRSFAIILLIGNIIIFQKAYIRGHLELTPTIHERQIVHSTFVKKKHNHYSSHSSYINGDLDTAIIKFKSTKQESFYFKTGPVITNQILRIRDSQGAIILDEKLKQSDIWILYTINYKLLD